MTSNEEKGKTSVEVELHRSVEVSLCGSWIVENVEAHEGVFLTVMSDRSEFFIYTHISSLA